MHLHDPLCTTKKDAPWSLRGTGQLKLRKMQDSWLSARTDEIQGYADKNDIKNLYNNLKEVYGPTSVGSSPLLSANGTKLISEEQDPGEVGWAFRWCTKQTIFYRRQGRWTTAASPSEWITRCNSKFRELSVSYPSAKHLDLTQFLRKSIKRVDQRRWVNFWPSFSWYEWKNNYRRTSKMPPLSIVTNGKGTVRHMIITAESLYFPFWARS